MAIYRITTMTSMTILQGVTELDTSPLRQIPEQCQRTLSNATIERLRAGRELKNRNGDRSVITAAMFDAANELGIKIVLKGNIYEWNRLIELLDSIHPDWRGYTVHVNHDVSQWVAA